MMLERLGAELGIAERVDYLGFISDSTKLRELYRRASVLALPSAYEGLPMVLLEAMSCGTPVVGSEIPAIAEVIERGRTGLLVPVGEPGSLAEALAEAVGRRDELGAAARASILANYDQAVVGPRLAEMLRAARWTGATSRARGPVDRDSRPAKAVAVPCVDRAGAASSAHLLVLLAAAVGGRRRSPPPASAGLALAVVVPAHNEETQIAATLRSIRQAGYPAARCRIVVVADNCSDRTAEVGTNRRCRGLGASRPFHRGKGTRSIGRSRAWSRMTRSRRVRGRRGLRDLAEPAVGAGRSARCRRRGGSGPVPRLQSRCVRRGGATLGGVRPL